MSGDDESTQLDKARAFRLLALMTFAADFWIWSTERVTDPAWLEIALPSAFTACLLVGLFRARVACAAAALLLLGYVVWFFPWAGNHPGLYLICATLLAAVDLEKPDERAVLLDATRWLTVIVFFATGLQKGMYGTYFEGEFLGYAVAHFERFETVFSLLIPADELMRLSQIGAPVPGAGPYTVEAPLFVLASNGAYLGEMGLALLLIPRATRVFAALAALALLLAIQSAAHELFFGTLFANLLLLFLPGDQNRKLLPWFAVLYASALIAVLGFGWDVVIT